MDLPNDILKEVSTDRIRKHIAALEGTRHPHADPVALEQAAEYIEEFLQSLGYRVTDHCFGEGCGLRNVVATRDGVLRPEERVLVLAHYDTVATTPGADDNASGVAVLLELATVLKGHRFERTVEFVAVNLEENESEDDPGSGVRGSTALADYAREKGWQVEGVVVLESVAYASPAAAQKAPAGLPVAVPEVGDFLAVIGNEASAALVVAFQQAVRSFAIPLPCVPLTVPGNGELLPDSRRSDHAPFWDRGYRAIMLTDTTGFRNPHYHAPGDTLDTLNLPFAAEVCRACSAFVAELAVLRTATPPSALNE